MVAVRGVAQFSRYWKNGGFYAGKHSKQKALKINHLRHILVPILVGVLPIYLVTGSVGRLVATLVGYLVLRLDLRGLRVRVSNRAWDEDLGG